MQTLIESGDRKLNNIQVSFYDLQGICDRNDTAQNELEISEDTNQYCVQELFENQYYEMKANFSELIHRVIDTRWPRNNALRSSGSGKSNRTPRSARLAHILSYQPLHCQQLKVKPVAGYSTETHLRH